MIKPFPYGGAKLGPIQVRVRNTIRKGTINRRGRASSEEAEEGKESKGDGEDGELPEAELRGGAQEPVGGRAAPMADGRWRRRQEPPTPVPHGS